MAGAQSVVQRELTGNCGKRGNKWEKLGKSDPRVGNRGKEWEILGSMNWINGAILDRKSRRKRGGTEFPPAVPDQASKRPSVRPSVRTEDQGPKDQKTTGPRTTGTGPEGRGQRT